MADLGGAMTEVVPRLLGAVAVMILAPIVALAPQRPAARLLGAQGLPLSENIATGRYIQKGWPWGGLRGQRGGYRRGSGRTATTLRSQDGYLYRAPDRALLEDVVGKRA